MNKENIACIIVIPVFFVILILMYSLKPNCIMDIQIDYKYKINHKKAIIWSLLLSSSLVLLFYLLLCNKKLYKNPNIIATNYTQLL